MAPRQQEKTNAPACHTSHKFTDKNSHAEQQGRCPPCSALFSHGMVRPSPCGRRGYPGSSPPLADPLPCAPLVASPGPCMASQGAESCVPNGLSWHPSIPACGFGMGLTGVRHIPWPIGPEGTTHLYPRRRISALTFALHSQLATAEGQQTTSHLQMTGSLPAVLPPGGQQWADVPHTDLAFDLDREMHVVATYVLGAQGSATPTWSATSSLPSASLLDLLGARLVVDGVPCRVSGSHARCASPPAARKRLHPTTFPPVRACL